MLHSQFLRSDGVPALWKVFPDPIDYEEVQRRMHATADNFQREEVWLIESPAGLSKGNDAKEDDRGGSTLPVYRAVGRNRPGSYTLHGPGIRGIILIMDLAARRKNPRGFVRTLEEWIINSLAAVGIIGERNPIDPAGIWAGGNKLASIGLRVDRWITRYGVGLYVSPNIADYAGVRLCGIPSAATSIRRLGKQTTMAEMDKVLREQFELFFGPTSLADAQ